MSSNSDEEDQKMPAVRPYEVNDGEEQGRKRIRMSSQDKKRSMRHRKDVDHQKMWLEYSAFMNANLEKKKNYHESPLFVVRRSLYLIFDNSICLKKPTISGNNFLERKIFYEIERISENVRLHMKNKKYRNVLKLEEILFYFCCSTLVHNMRPVFAQK